MFKILIVEDDNDLRNLFSMVLKSHNYEVVQAKNGVEALACMDSEYIDLLISDLMMPQMDGYTLLKEIRSIKNDLPILLISAKETFADKKKAFLAGSDDYMVKPIDVNEMVLRVQALLRRAKIVSERKLAFGDTLLEYDSLTVHFKNNSVLLPQKEFYLLYKLASNPNKIYTRQNLMDEIWGLESESDERTVDVHINRLREHFKEVLDFEIVTIRGLGYKMVRKNDEKTTF